MTAIPLNARRRFMPWRIEPAQPANRGQLRAVVNALPVNSSVSQDKFMVGQLVMRLAGHNAPVIDIVNNDENRAPITFEHPEQNVQIPRLGSSQLIFLTEYLQSLGYIVDGFQLADAHMSPVLGDEADEASETLVHAMREDGASRVRELLARELHPLIVVGVDFTTDEFDELTLKQDGVALGGSITEPATRNQIAHALTDAWKLAALR